MTLLLGSPGCGKTSLLKALSGNLDHSCKVSDFLYMISLWLFYSVSAVEVLRDLVQN